MGQDGVRSAGDGYAAAADFELTVHDADGGLVRGAEVPALDAERAACELDELVYVLVSVTPDIMFSVRLPPEMSCRGEKSA